MALNEKFASNSDIEPSDEPIETFDNVPGRRVCSWVNGHYICEIILDEQVDD